MNTKIKLLILGLLINICNINAQSFECGVLTTKEMIQKSIENRKKRQHKASKLIDTLYVKVQPHIIRDSFGEKGLQLYQLDKAIKDLNDRFAQANMVFNITPVKYIDNDDYHNELNIAINFNSMYNEADIADDAINVFFCRRLKNFSKSLAGSATIPNRLPEDYVILKNNAYSDGSTLAHEIGHYFGLYHTHCKTNGVEMVIRPNDSEDENCMVNCETAGDTFCDTPAEPSLLNRVDRSTCAYSGLDTDTCGYKYVPDVTNIMSYSDSKCQFYFSPQQIMEMRSVRTSQRAYIDVLYTVFQNYPWLNSLVNQNNCNNESIKVYDAGNYKLIYFQNGSNGNLYYENGSLYCSGDNCVQNNGLNNMVAEWSCNKPPAEIFGCTDPFATNYNALANIDDESCEYVPIEIFRDFPWLSTIVDQNNCTNEIITVYRSFFKNSINSYGQLVSLTVRKLNYIEIRNDSEARLYYQDGTFLCLDQPGYLCKQFYLGENFSDDAVASWTCENVPNDIKGCTDPTACNYTTLANADDGSCIYGDCNNSIFNDYPWLNTIINPDNCSGETITIYDAGSYNFIHIQNDSNGDLYYQDGTFYCSDAPGYSCVTAYNLSNIAESWSCSNSSSNLVFNNYSWLSTLVNQSNCTNETITVYDAGSYHFIHIQNGSNGDLYYQDGTFYCSDAPNYSCVDAYGLSNVVSSWSCENTPIEVLGCTDSSALNYNPSATVNDGSCEFIISSNRVFDEYPWLNTLVDQNNCDNEIITIYDAGIYNFIHIQNGIKSDLYYQDGTFYCSDVPGYSCVAAYGLTTVSGIWACAYNSKATSSNFATEEQTTKLTQQAQKLNVSIYPNPASDKVFVDLQNVDNATTQITLLDMQGKVLEAIKVDDSEKQAAIDVSSYTKGVYLVRLENSNTTAIKKLFIQ